MDEIRYETPTPEHAGSLLLQVAIAFDRYKEFAGQDWEPPDTITPERAEKVRANLASPDYFALMAVYGEDPIGHTVWGPARGDNEPDGDLIPGLCHVSAVFVLEPWWGRGVATALHAAGREEMTRRGWAEARLYTPARQHRARRFYEREGWRLEVDSYFEPRTNLDMVEYRLPLSDASP